MNLLEAPGELAFIETDEEYPVDDRQPWLLVAVRNDGNGVVLDYHNDCFEYFIDGDYYNFMEYYWSDFTERPPLEMGLYEWTGSVSSKRDSWTGEYDYSFIGTWTALYVYEEKK
jgi:hypothetical protein